MSQTGEKEKTLTKDMSATQGIKLWGEEAVAAIFKEFEQMDKGPKENGSVVEPIDVTTLTDVEKRLALNAVNLIKRKRSLKLKAHTCANGSKQKVLLKDFESVYSLTVSFEAQIMTLLIDAIEKRKVVTFDIPGAYLHADMPEEKKLLLKMRGQFLDIMCNVNDQYSKHVIYENGQKVLYMKIKKALYGCIESALIWYDLYVSVLKDEGFELNPYDKCVANKTVNGSQCTIAWYVDDNKVSHKDQKVVEDILELMTKRFGEMTITRGKKHDFLGFTFTIHEKKIEIDMKEQINEAITMFMDDVIDKVASPASGKLFESGEGKYDGLNHHRKENYHSMVMKLMYIMKRARPDIEVAVAYLSTRVMNPNKNDWKKLKRVLCFLKETIGKTRFIGASDLSTMYTWVDASHAVYENMRSQTGGAISMGTGLLHAKSGKQKLNGKSSTESEVIGVSDYLPFMIWFQNFLKHQGYELKRNILFQDNQSAIKMERNGRSSCTGNSRHIDIRFFFTKDRFDKKEFEIEYCPTAMMLADFFTKPLQGALFWKFWKVVMGHEHISTLRSSAIENKERVDHNEFDLVLSSAEEEEKRERK